MSVSPASPQWISELPPKYFTDHFPDELSRAIESSDEDGLRCLRNLRRSRPVPKTESLPNDTRGLSAVHVAVLWKRYKTLRALLDSKVVHIDQPSTNAGKKGWTALHFAAFSMDLRAINLLLKFNCSTSAVTELGSTPLHFVTGRFGQRGPHLADLVHCVMRTLITAGVSPEAENKYGYTVMHESIMWSDETSLGIMLQQNTAQYFQKLLFIGHHVLPHELARRSHTLPCMYKRCLERTYFDLKMLKQSAGVSIRVPNTHDRQLYKYIECISVPSPPTVGRINLLHPESLTDIELGSLLQTVPQKLIVELLKYQQDIVEYMHFSSGETRYIFPAYFRLSVAEWVCTDCHSCRVAAGRWLETASTSMAMNLLINITTKILSEQHFTESDAVAGHSVYFASETGAQLGIRYIDRIRSQGVLVQVCSNTDEAITECRSLLEYAVDSAYSVLPGLGPVAVVSSQDLKAGKALPHIYPQSEVSQALANGTGFLCNPESLLSMEEISDLLLTNPHTETFECDGVVDDRDLLFQTSNSSYSGEDQWGEDVYIKAVETHKDEMKLINPDVVVKCLVSAGAFSPADQRYVTTGEARDKVPRLLERVEQKGVYHVCFAILNQTGTELPDHGRLYDILHKEINCSGNFYLDQGDLPQPLYCPDDNTSINTQMSHSAPSGRVTRESGYGSHVYSSLGASQLISLSLTALSGHLVLQSFPDEQSGPPPFTHTTLPSGENSILEPTSMPEPGSPVQGISYATSKEKKTSLALSNSTQSSFSSSIPMNIPSASYALSHSLTSITQEQPTSATAVARATPMLKCLPRERQTSIWQRILGALFSAPEPSDGGTRDMFGLKQM